jgi:hypothetical protein
MRKLELASSITRCCSIVGLITEEDISAVVPEKT